MSVRRTAAVIALTSGAIAIALLVVIAVHAMPRGLFVVGLLAVASVGAWYAIVGPLTLRVLGGAAAVIGLGGSLWLMLDGRIVDEIALILAAAVCSVCTRAAFWARADLRRVAPPEHPVLFFNPLSGGGKAERFRLAEEAERRGFDVVELRPGDDLEVLVRRAVADGADALAMAGGDGSQAVVASVASELDLPYACIPAGTRNHFACDLGVDRDDVAGALDAFVDGGERRVDLAEVNGRVFVNNASMGLYAKIVQSAEYRDAKVQTAAEVLPDLIGPDAAPLDLQFTLPSGERATSANLILVSNNPYQLAHLRGAALRPRLDRGELGVVTLQVSGAADAHKLAALEVAGQVSRFRGWNEWTPTEFEVASDGPVEVGVDGEALIMHPPLRFVIRPGALTIRQPRAVWERPELAPAVHLASSSTLTALWRTALGRSAAG